MHAENEFPDYYHSLEVVKKIVKTIVGSKWPLLSVWSVISAIFDQVSKLKGMEKVGMWADRIVNHFWWCCWGR